MLKKPTRSSRWASKFSIPASNILDRTEAEKSFRLRFGTSSGTSVPRTYNFVKLLADFIPKWLGRMNNYWMTDDAMRLTGSAYASRLPMTKTIRFRLTLALGSGRSALKKKGLFLVLIHNYSVDEHVVVIPDVVYVDLRVLLNPRGFDHAPIGRDAGDRLGEFVVHGPRILE
jgi:hypothetical protein